MKAWRESASLIIAARNGLKYNNHSFDYNLLFLKRHQKTRFGGTFVFPGGMIETADADLKWKNLFKSHGYNDNSFKYLFPNTISRPDIFHTRKGQLPREISLRISAIRETFEECGILLCKKSSESAEVTKTAHNFYMSNDEIEFWQHKVHSGANEFYNMCEKLQCHPNLWALHEWGNWLTPTFFPASLRFNTAFFFACLPHVPNTKLEITESEELVWETPDSMMKLFRTYLPPPQQYEILKIAKFKSLDDLLKFALEKSKNGVELYMSVRVLLLDGAVQLLPGDSMYPKKVDLYKAEIIDKTNMTIKQFRDMSSSTHRIEFFDDPESKDEIYSKL